MNLRPSVLSADSRFAFRDHLFTPWMTAQTLQVLTAAKAAMSMAALYSEYEPDFGFREIYWAPGIPTYYEVRSGRTWSEFLDIARRNREEGNVLSTLHVSSDGLYSSCWLSAQGLAHAAPLLEALGISPAMVEE